MTAIKSFLLTPVSAQGLRAFRVAFGLMMAIAMGRFVVHGWIDEFYVAPTLHFTYAGFGWIEPWPRWGMYAHVIAAGVAALCVAAGWRYRWSLSVFLVLFAYLELLDKTTYLNHYYFVTLLAALMLLLPLDRRDAERPVARWQLWMMRWQVGIVYFFAGVAKLNSDWLFKAQPLKLWFAANADVAVIGPLLALPAAPWVASWASMLMDLSAPFLLCWRRTRLAMFGVVVAFHATTALLFNLGLFPWLMIAAATLFFDSNWPARHAQPEGRRASAVPQRPLRGLGMTGTSLLSLHFLFQCVWPLRHHVYDTDLLWAEDGFRFSWNVMVMEKAGSIAFDVKNPKTGESWRVYPHDDLSPLQAKMMATQPDMILQYARHLAHKFGDEVAVHADSRVSLNGRAGRPLVDASVDLTHLRDDLGPRHWVTAPEGR
jgi:vitamin K-dependent gamma-carboxylase